MGNSIWCSAPGERLASAARDGDLAEARLLLEHKPLLATYSAFASLNSPLHLAASKGHAAVSCQKKEESSMLLIFLATNPCLVIGTMALFQMVMLLLENGADVNSRNFCGQTALMQACRRGHWEVVQALLIFRTDVTRAEYLSRKTGLHFAAAGGHIRCIRLLVADFVPSDGASIFSTASGKRRCGGSSAEPESSVRINALSRFVNKAADGGVTALHLAALNGHSDCVQLLLDLHANVSAITYHYGSSSSKMIGSGSTPLHFAASEGNFKCCQVLLARGASRLTLNYNGWLPVDVAKQWGHRFLEPLLSPHSDLKVPTFPPSSYLSLPLRSILNIARECRLRSLTASSDENDLCAICLENTCSVAAEGCAHELCVKCALYLCSTSKITSQVAGPPGSIPCPLCRNGIVSFIKLAHIPAEEEAKFTKFKSLCTHLHDAGRAAITCRSEFYGNSMPAVSSPELV